MAPIGRQYSELDRQSVDLKTASIIISALAPCCLVLSLWICACCSSKRSTKQPTGGATGVDDVEKESKPLERPNSDSPRIVKNKGRKKKRSPVVVNKVVTTFTVPVRTEYHDTSTTELPKQQTKGDTGTNSNAAATMPTVLRATGLSPPPSMHVPSLLPGKTTMACTIKKTTAKPKSKSKVPSSKTEKAELTKRTVAIAVATTRGKTTMVTKADTVMATKKALLSVAKTRMPMPTKRLKFELPGRPDSTAESIKVPVPATQTSKPFVVAKTVLAPVPQPEKSEVKRSISETNRLTTRPVSTELMPAGEQMQMAMSYEVKAPRRQLKSDNAK